MKTAPIIVSIVLVVLVAIAIVFEGDTTGSKQTVKIGALMPTTGSLQVFGEASINGLRLAIDEVNAAGGVLGGDVELVFGDTQTNPQAGVDAAKRLVSIERVAGLVGALSSGVTIPIASSVSSVEKVPQISNASTSPVITGLADNDFLFRTVPHDALQGVILANVMKQQGIDKVSVIYINNDYGQGLAEALEQSFSGTITGMVAYEEKQASYRGELLKAKKGGADTLVLIGYPGDGIPILRQSLEGGIFDRFVFTDGMKAQEVVDSVGGDLLDGTFGTAPGADPDSETAKRFREMYEAKFGELPPQPFIDSSYDAGILLTLAIHKAGSTDGVAVRDALREVAGPPGAQFGPGQFAEAKAALDRGEDIDYQGAAGSQDFDANGDVPGTYSHWAIQGGKIVEVELIRP
ncbi:MAG: ABC transporter substrate-binding protein [Alphaproteobacteria bacterium]|nr:ABC transporter substrate-binding protein [Alphaproteobacteria bacterium]MCZ6510338.1 ABC transporter substrate-binding protein [Alphaproteobacteria bacterium]MCZ6590254.1 ABC transporter substrate-binding protein [Alphaproteobacteria bacterium]MCZ6840572.1 ABC transporter substrate-binding protein [Alphaproteobacteria bacterium]